MKEPFLEIKVSEADLNQTKGSGGQHSSSGQLASLIAKFEFFFLKPKSDIYSSDKIFGADLS